MKNRFWIFRRGSTYYIEDAVTGAKESLRTKDKKEAERLRLARNEAVAQPNLNLSLGRAYPAAHDPMVPKRTWGLVMDAFIARSKKPSTRLRPSTVGLNTATAVLYTYGYDTASRLTSVGDGSVSATYTYLANSPLLGQVDFKQSGTPRMITTKQYDTLNRLRTTASTAGGNTFSYGYHYNEANQRTKVNLADGAYWVYRYDALGQVISGKKYFQDNTPVPGQQFEYGFDDIGNRVSSKVGGDSNGINLRSASYTRNLLNQYSSRTVPSVLDILGLAPATSAVTVNTLATDYLRGEYFQKGLTVANSSAPAWTSVTNSSAGGTPVTINILTPPASQGFTYDPDGNQTNDSVWAYSWDAENRLVSMTNLTTLATTNARVKMTFEYDHLGRRIRKKTFPWASTNYSPTASSDVRFAYDGWNLLATLPAASTTPTQTYLWGMDLSSSPQGAGGVGGLIAIKDSTQGQHFAVYDANGNVMGLVSAANSAATAAYEYGPFGEVIRSSGLMAKLNPYRFSTKYQDNESDLLYYGYRYYSQSTGRWLNRDPIEEAGGRNLNGFVSNNPVLNADAFGQYELDFHFYAIYYILRSKCYSREDAKNIAWESQYVDDNPLTDPLKLGMRVYFGDLSAAYTLADYHFVGSTSTSATKSGEPKAMARAVSAANSFTSGGDATYFGAALHSYADTWSHEGFTAWRNKTINNKGGVSTSWDLSEQYAVNYVFVGHANLSHEPDEPFRNPGRALSAALAIYDAIPDRCLCGPSSTEYLVTDLVTQFSSIHPLDGRCRGFRRLIQKRFNEDVSDEK